MIITWKTNKTATGFTGTVLTVEYQKPCKTLKIVEGCKSRAIAKRQAIKWARHFKAKQAA